MKIVKVISEHKHIRKTQPLKSGYKRIEAVVIDSGCLCTKHIDIPTDDQQKDEKSNN